MRCEQGTSKKNEGERERPKYWMNSSRGLAMASHTNSPPFCGRMNQKEGNQPHTHTRTHSVCLSVIPTTKYVRRKLNRFFKKYLGRGEEKIQTGGAEVYSHSIVLFLLHDEYLDLKKEETICCLYYRTHTGRHRQASRTNT